MSFDILCNKKEIVNLIKSLNTVAPFIPQNDYVKKYPYKYFLFLSLIKRYRKTLFSNEWLEIDKPLIKYFYDFLTSDYFFFEAISEHKSKYKWGLGFNAKVEKGIKNLITSMPLKKLKCNSFLVEKSKFKLMLNIDFELQDECLSFLEKTCILGIKKCLPEYKEFSINEIEDIMSFYENKFLIENQIDLLNENDYKNRPFQHIFRKKVLDRDQKCLICCEENYLILEACHIKPYSICINYEKINLNNGLVLCRNHHKLFDAGKFTFDKNLNLVISKELEEMDDFFYKKHENCFKNIDKRLSITCFLEYHYNNIFQK